MPLASGTKLGAYEIVALIGAGGMGEVYEGKDTRLDRSVAIKVLPEQLSHEPERRERFEREARAVSSLNHPHICTLYDVGEQDGIVYIVMELIEGETLAARLQKGPLPLEEALRIGAQIADALDKAHRQGVVHRDVKPGNAMLTKTGVKLLDFGLATRLRQPVRRSLGEGGGFGEAGADSALPTVAKSLTAEGSIIGTFQYMAPEQLEGKDVDGRTDLFAFGAVLYEMLTGRKAFEGESQASLISAIMTSDPPPISKLQAMAPPALDHVVETCLAKNPEDRWQTAGDLGRQLTWLLAGNYQPSAPTPLAGAARPAGWRPSVGVAVATALVLSALTGFAVWSLSPVAPRPVQHFVATPPSADPINLDTQEGNVAITPDGTRIVYAVSFEGRRHLYVRSLGELEGMVLTGLGLQTRNPFVSPDGNWVGYVEDRTLYKVSILGGPPVALSNLIPATTRGASWGDDNTIVFATAGASGGGLWEVSAGGGEPQPLTTPEPGEEDHRWPEILPGGGAVLFTIMNTAVENAQIAVYERSTGEYRVLVPGGSNPRYVPSGHIVYGVGGTLRAVGFDVDRLEVTNDPIPVLDGVITKNSGAAEFSVSQNGSLVYITGDLDSGATRSLVWVDREGREEALAAEPRAYTSPRISPDGTRLALDIRDQENDIWIWDFARETLSRFTFHPNVDGRQVWTRDGQQLVFESHREGEGNVFAKAARGTGQVERLTESPRHQDPLSVSPDGASILFEDGRTPRNLSLLPFSGGGETRPLLHSEFNETNGEIAPDSRWLAYQSDESGQDEVYVRPFPNVDEGQWQISRGGGEEPLWAPNGRELFYVAPEGQLMAVPVHSDENFDFGSPEIAVSQRYFRRSGAGRGYDISPDGERFLMIKETDATTDEPRELILVQNWIEELKRLVPTS